MENLKVLVNQNHWEKIYQDGGVGILMKRTELFIEYVMIN